MGDETAPELDFLTEDLGDFSRLAPLVCRHWSGDRRDRLTREMGCTLDLDDRIEVFEGREAALRDREPREPYYPRSMDPTPRETTARPPARP